MEVRASLVIRLIVVLSAGDGEIEIGILRPPCWALLEDLEHLGDWASSLLLLLRRLMGVLYRHSSSILAGEERLSPKMAFSRWCGMRG